MLIESGARGRLVQLRWIFHELQPAGSRTSASAALHYNFTATDDPENMRSFDFANDLYNFGPLNHYQRPERRYNLGAMGHYEFNEHADVYTQLMFNDYESIAQIAPGGAFGETTSINCGNPLIPTNILGTMGCDAGAIAANTSVPFFILRRNIEGGGRQQSFANQTFRTVVGVRGAINEAWGYDASAQYSQGTGTNSTLNYFQIARVANALNVVDVAGVPTCQSVIDLSDTNCVPWNPFVVGGTTQDQLDYLQVKGIQVGRINQEIYNGIITGDLGVYGAKSPWSSDGIQLVFGAEYRRDSMDHKVDALQEQAQLAGSGGATIGKIGSTQVEELFMEARVPIAQDQAFAESLSFDTAYRYSDYGDGVQTDTYKFGLEWAPIADVRLRGSFQRAVRAANIVELFTAQGFNLFDAPGDPCGWALNTPNPATDNPAVNAPLDPALSALCQQTGVPVGNLGSSVLDSPAGQYSFLQGGNLELTPEESDTMSYGVVFQPRFAPGLAVTVDYFDIEIEDTISTIGANNTFTACYEVGNLDACALMDRHAASGALWIGDGNVIDTNVNIGSLSTKGYDVNVSYSGLEMGRFGSLALSMTGTYLEELITQPVPGLDIDPTDRERDYYDCTGFYSTVCGIPNPQWRHRFRTSWQTPWDLDLSLTWRYYHSVTGLAQANDQMPAGQLDEELAAENYFDLAANWAITEKTAVTLGINNVLDDNPSISGAVGTTGNGNTFPQTYDALGRYVFLRATVDF